MLYHISPNVIEVLQPRVPSNFFTDRGYEDNSTCRVSFAHSIDCCTMALGCNAVDKVYNVYTPIEESIEYYSPTVEEVPDCIITGEVWVTKPVKVKKLGVIRITSCIDEETYLFHYGDKTERAYKFKWFWVSEG